MPTTTRSNRKALARTPTAVSPNFSYLRVAVVSDTHGYVDPRIVAAASACDVVLHAGDVGNSAVLAQLQPRHGQLHAVRGNNDTPAKWPGDEQEALQQLPTEVRLPLPGGDLVAVHGDRALPAARRHERLRRLYPDARAVVYGHTHRLVCDRAALPWVLNPGAAGRDRTFGGPAFLMLEVDARRWRVQALRFER